MKRNYFHSAISLLVCMALLTGLLSTFAVASATSGAMDGISWKFENNTLSFEGSGSLGITNFDMSTWLIYPWADYQNDILYVEVGEGITELGYYIMLSASNYLPR